MIQVIITSSVGKAARKEIDYFVNGESGKEDGGGGGICHFAQAINKRLEPSDINISEILMLDSGGKRNKHKKPIDDIMTEAWRSNPTPADYYNAKDEGIRKKGKSLGWWWLKGVEIAFKRGADYVFFYPQDVKWNDSAQNTVVQPNCYARMIKAVSSSPDLIIGNYVSTSTEKEEIERKVLDHVLDGFRDHPHYSKFKEYFHGENAIKRIRTEFWGARKEFFKGFQDDNPNINSSDPTIELILHAIRKKATIAVINLGTYTSAPPEDQKLQQDRVKPIIRAHRLRFDGWC